jgi:hypothetical protein
MILDRLTATRGAKEIYDVILRLAAQGGET